MSLRKLFIAVLFVTLIFSNLGLTALRQGSISNISKASWNKGVELLTKGNRSTTNIMGTRYYMRLHSLCQRITDKRVVTDPAYPIVKLNNGYLDYATLGNISEESVLVCEQYAEAVSLFHKKLRTLNIPFVFVMSPVKSHCIDKQTPRGCKPEFTNELADIFLKMLEEKQVPFFDVRTIFKDNPDKHYSLFFKGDHHWKPEYALIAYQNFWDFNYNKNPETPTINLDWLEHIQPKQYPFDYWEQFQINKTGEYYADYEQSIIHYIPQFDTDIIVSRPYRNYKKCGSFEQTRVSDYYRYNPSLKIAINKKINSVKIVYIKDSFGLPWFDFLTLSCHEVHMLDLRGYYKSPIKYIEQVKPNMVIVLYHPGVLNKQFTDFFHFQTESKTRNTFFQ